MIFFGVLFFIIEKSSVLVVKLGVYEEVLLFIWE